VDIATGDATRGWFAAGRVEAPRVSALREPVHENPFVVRSDRGGCGAGERECVSNQTLGALAFVLEQRAFAPLRGTSRLLLRAFRRADLDPPMRGGWVCCLSSRARSRAFTALRAASHFLLLAQEKVTKEKGTPDFPWRAKSARHALRCSESVGRRELAHPCAQTCAPFPAGFLRYSAGKTGTEKRRARSQSSLRLAKRLHPLFLILRGIAPLAESRAKRSEGVILLWLLALGVPIRLAPSSGARTGSKARMFEATDGRVRAGPVLASSAGHRAGLIGATRDWGVLLFGYFLLDKQEKVTRAPKGRESC
jgi:hypothetical protein